MPWCLPPLALPTIPTNLPDNRHPRRPARNGASGEHAISADPLGKPVRGIEDYVLGRLTAIDHRLHQISTQLTTMGTLLSQLDKISANLETLIGSLVDTASLGVTLKRVRSGGDGPGRAPVELREC